MHLSNEVEDIRCLSSSQQGWQKENIAAKKKYCCDEEEITTNLVNFKLLNFV